MKSIKYNTLSPRARQVLKLVGDGMTMGEAAGKLGISVHTADTYIRRAYKVLGVSNRIDALKALARLGTGSIIIGGSALPPRVEVERVAGGYKIMIMVDMEV